MCIESIELSSTHSYTWLAHSCSGQWHHCWVPILLGLNTQAESWAINGNNMFSSCSHHASFPSKRIKGRVWSPACQAVINVLSTAAISCLFFAAIALPRAMKTDRKGWQQNLKSYRGRYVTSSNIKNFLSVSWVDPVPPVLRPAVPQALPSRNEGRIADPLGELSGSWYMVDSKLWNMIQDLVGGWATPLKNMKVNWGDYSQYMGK